MINDFEMPVLRPVRIPTRGLSFFKKVWVWLFSVRTFEVSEDWNFVINISFLGVEVNSPVTIVIPKGFIFDGASIPRPLWFFLSPFGILMIPGLIHDFYYKYNCLILVDSNDQSKSLTYSGLGQIFADQLFRDVGVFVNGMPFLTGLAYYVLRAFGFVAWNNHRKINSQDEL